MMLEGLELILGVDKLSSDQGGALGSPLSHRCFRQSTNRESANPYRVYYNLYRDSANPFMSLMSRIKRISKFGFVLAIQDPFHPDPRTGVTAVVV